MNPKLNVYVYLEHHQDHFEQTQQEVNEMLEGWKQGHILQIQNHATGSVTYIDSQRIIKIETWECC